MRGFGILRAAIVAGLLSLASGTVFGNTIGANGCVGGLCSGVLDTFNGIEGNLVDSTSTSFTAYNAQNVALYGGSLRSAVYRNLSNTLDFYFQFANNADSLDSVGRMTMTNFTGFVTDVGYLTALNVRDSPFTNGTQAPLSADRSASGGTVGFGFAGDGGRIDPAETSSILVIRTNATTYGAGSVTTQNGAVYTASAFAPVPEPGTYMLIGAGLTALAFIRRRK